tara:strand:- start:248 stop:445 length:198 start_codon:yes stop_codon:yes gene_type:complete
MSSFSKFIKEVVLPETVSKERRKKILDDGIIATWNNDQTERNVEEAKEIAKRTYKKARSSEDKGD